MSIYLDHHATTPVDPRVLAVMLPCFTETFGNPSSRTHRFGWDARDVVERGRKQVATLIGAAARDVIFTSGATEANALAIDGVAQAALDRRHIVTLITEHKAVLDACRALEERGWQVTYLPVRRDGLVDIDEMARAMRPDTALVSVMLAHNEIGVIQPIAEIARVAHAHGALMHTDAVQALGKIPVDVTTLGVDLASFSAHKVYGPKGVGALYVRKGVETRLRPLVRGGGQERGLRGGTLNVPGIAGLGEACRIARTEMDADARRLRDLRDRLWHALETQVGGVTTNGAMEPRLPNNLNVSFDGVDGEALLLGLTDIAVSSGAACTSTQPSHVLTALGLDTNRALASLRFGLGRGTTTEEIDAAAAHVAAVVSHLRRTSPRTAHAAAMSA
ncbi:MAG: cysteine desulfurase [Acidobacteria bacterium]|nr:cysteine desulfurase [Acidobacteriota bacterium]